MYLFEKWFQERQEWVRNRHPSSSVEDRWHRFCAPSWEAHDHIASGIFPWALPGAAPTTPPATLTATTIDPKDHRRLMVEMARAAIAPLDPRGVVAAARDVGAAYEAAMSLVRKWHRGASSVQVARFWAGVGVCEHGSKHDLPAMVLEACRLSSSPVEFMCVALATHGDRLEAAVREHGACWRQHV
jgi:hypothetical protein